jgi:hypothetical protein
MASAGLPYGREGMCHEISSIKGKRMKECTPTALLFRLFNPMESGCPHGQGGESE